MEEDVSWKGGCAAGDWWVAKISNQLGIIHQNWIWPPAGQESQDLPTLARLKQAKYLTFASLPPKLKSR